MARRIWTTIAVLVLGGLGLSSPLLLGEAEQSATTEPTASAGDRAIYLQTLQKRTAGIIAPLKLDEAKGARVQAILVDQYVALKDWQNTLAGKKPDAAAKGELKQLHESFLAKLGTELTREQIEAVEDGMTVNKVRVTYDAYCRIVPNLTDGEKAKILEYLKQAREEAIDGTSMEAKSAVFKKYRGKINLFLTADGHDVAKAYKDWGASQKAKAGVSATEPSATQSSGERVNLGAGGGEGSTGDRS